MIELMEHAMYMSGSVAFIGLLLLPVLFLLGISAFYMVWDTFWRHWHRKNLF